MWLHYLWWIPWVILYFATQGYLSAKINLTHEKTWVVALYLTKFFPTWILVAWISKSVIVDGFIFDMVVMISFAFSLSYFSGKMLVFTAYHWIGILLMIMGIIIFKISG